MASTLHKRLLKLEEAMAHRIDAPIAQVWVDHDFTLEGANKAREEVLDQMVAAGTIKPNQRDRVKIMRWATREEVLDKSISEPAPSLVITNWRSRHAAGTVSNQEAAPSIFEPANKEVELGPPDETSTDGVTPPPAPVARKPEPIDMEAAETRYTEALRPREREDIQDKLDAASRLFHRSIV